MTVSSYAGIGVCHDGSGNMVSASKSTTPENFKSANCEYYSIPPTSKAKYERVKTVLTTVPFRYIKWDTEPVEMTQAEKDAVDQAIADKQAQEEQTRVENLDITIKDAFQAWLQVYNSKVPAQNRVTGQELIDQLKTNLQNK